jgi:hypothetical protein
VALRTRGHESLVFVDDSGRRARGVRVAGLALAIVCTLWLAGLAVGVTDFSGFTARLPALAHTGLRRSKIAAEDAVAERTEISHAKRLLPVTGASLRPRWQTERQRPVASLRLAGVEPGTSPRAQ